MTADSDAEGTVPLRRRLNHTTRVETNAHDIELVFSDLRIDQIATGHTVLVIDETGPDYKNPL